MSLATVAIIALLALGCALLVSCALALDLRAADKRSQWERERDAHADERRGIQ